MANPNLLTRADLVAWLTNCAAQLTAHVAVPITNGAQDALAATIGGFATALGADETDVVDAKAAYEAAVQQAELAQVDLLSGIQAGKYGFKAVAASPDSYASIGLTPPAVGRNAIVPMPPEIVAVVGLSNSTNVLTLTNGNTPGTVSLEIWRRSGGPLQPWVIVGTTKKQKFVDEGVTMGVMTEYKLRAVTTQRQSAYSNTAACYTDPVPGP